MWRWVMRRWVMPRWVMRRWVRALPPAAAMCMLLCGCGSDPKPQPVVAAVPSAPAPVAVPEDPTARMARAVGDGKPGAAVSIKYDLGVKPQVGVALPVKVMFAPTAGAEALEASFSGMDGIALSGTLSVSFEAVKSGELYPHEFIVTPERTGVFYVTVNTSTRFGGTSMARAFAIPFVVAEQQAPKAPPQKDVAGTPTQPAPPEQR